MATPMPAIIFVKEQSPRPARNLECAPQTSTHLIDDHRAKIDAEVERAKNSAALLEADGEQDVYSPETLDRAIAFLRRHMDWSWSARGSLAPIPAISPGPERSIDLYWTMSQRKLLVNIPAVQGAAATFYGTDDHTQKIKGSFDPRNLSAYVIAWLMD